MAAPKFKPLQAIFFASLLLSLAPVVSLLVLILEDPPSVSFGGRSRRRRRDKELKCLVQRSSFPEEMTQK